MQCERNVSCRVDRAEALRYLGYSDQRLSDDLEELIDRVIDQCEQLAQPSWCYRVFPFEVVDGRAALKGSTLGFPSTGPLSRASFCAVMACTIGIAHDREERRLAVSEATESVVFDAAGSALVEACAEACEVAVASWASARGLFAGQRTSPGYGELPLGLSGDVIRALDAGKLIGVTMAGSGLLVPMKSVTAIVGLFDREEDARRARRSCSDCIARRDCAYLKAGNPCNG